MKLIPPVTGGMPMGRSAPKLDAERPIGITTLNVVTSNERSREGKSR